MQPWLGPTEDSRIIHVQLVSGSESAVLESSVKPSQLAAELACSHGALGMTEDSIITDFQLGLSGWQDIDNCERIKQIG